MKLFGGQPDPTYLWTIKSPEVRQLNIIHMTILIPVIAPVRIPCNNGLTIAYMTTQAVFAYMSNNGIVPQPGFKEANFQSSVISTVEVSKQMTAAQFRQMECVVVTYTPNLK